MAARRPRIETQVGLGVASRYAEAITIVEAGVGAENEAADRTVERRRIAVAADAAESAKGLSPCSERLGRQVRSRDRVGCGEACGGAGRRRAIEARQSIEQRFARQARVVERRRDGAGVDLARERVEGSPGAGGGLAHQRLREGRPIASASIALATASWLGATATLPRATPLRVSVRNTSFES